mgnify:CR=1 FL=1
MTFAYKLLELGGLDHQGIEVALNKFGAGGWELVALLPPQTVILKNSGDVTARAAGRETQPVAANYRDPETGDTWLGRGRMASWLAESVRAGAKLEDFLAWMAPIRPVANVLRWRARRGYRRDDHTAVVGRADAAGAAFSAFVREAPRIGWPQ